MAVLIRDVLAYSQLSRENIVFEAVSLKSVIDDITTDLELLIEQKKASVITGELPVITAIPLQMSQLFANLLSNALKFSKPNELPVIQIRSQQLTSTEVTGYGIVPRHTLYNLIEVEDNGIGFHHDYSEQIFNIFQRLHGKMEYSGTGIGLAICKKIAQNHNGDIFAASTDGRGATFSIILPQDQVSS